MPSKYRIIQFVPDPLANERVNIGVITYDDHTVYVDVTKHWQRISAFAGRSTHFVRMVVEELLEAAGDQLPLPSDNWSRPLNKRAVDEILSKWSHSLQVTEPRGSLKNVADLRSEVSSRFVSRIATLPQYGRRAAALRLFGKVSKMIASWKGPDHLKEVQRKVTLKGAVDVHRFDVAYGKDSPRLIMHALPYSYRIGSLLGVSVDATKWAIDDIRKANASVPIGIVFYPTRRTTITEGTAIDFAHTIQVCKNLGAETMMEDQVSDWLPSRLPTSLGRFRWEGEE